MKIITVKILSFKNNKRKKKYEEKNKPRDTNAASCV